MLVICRSGFSRENRGRWSRLKSLLRAEGRLVFFSRFIAEQLAKRLQELEDEEVTRLYDEAYQDEHALRENQQLAEDMRHLRPRHDGDEAW